MNRGPRARGDEHGTLPRVATVARSGVVENALNHRTTLWEIMAQTRRPRLHNALKTLNQRAVESEDNFTRCKDSAHSQSLFSLLDATVTIGGHRMLRSWVYALGQRDDIGYDLSERRMYINFFLSKVEIRKELQQALQSDSSLDFEEATTEAIAWFKAGIPLTFNKVYAFINMINAWWTCLTALEKVLTEHYSELPKYSRSIEMFRQSLKILNGIWDRIDTRTNQPRDEQDAQFDIINKTIDTLREKLGTAFEDIKQAFPDVPLDLDKTTYVIHGKSKKVRESCKKPFPIETSSMHILTITDDGIDIYFQTKHLRTLANELVEFQLALEKQVLNFFHGLLKHFYENRKNFLGSIRLLNELDAFLALAQRSSEFPLREVIVLDGSELKEPTFESSSEGDRRQIAQCIAELTGVGLQEEIFGRGLKLEIDVEATIEGTLSEYNGTTVICKSRVEDQNDCKRWSVEVKRKDEKEPKVLLAVLHNYLVPKETMEEDRDGPRHPLGHIQGVGRSNLPYWWDA